MYCGFISRPNNHTVNVRIDTYKKLFSAPVATSVAKAVHRTVFFARIFCSPSGMFGGKPVFHRKQIPANAPA